MSLSLNLGTKPDGLVVITPLPSLSGQVVWIGEYQISLKDFLLMAEYVLTNTDLEADDLRLPFVECVKSMHVVQGYNKGGQRLASQRPPTGPT